MTQQHLLKLAMQGNTEAIETLINELLQPQGITAKVGSQQSSLYVALAAANVPKQQLLVPLIYQKILHWHVEYFQTAKIYAAAWGESSPAWQEEVLLSDAKSKNNDFVETNSDMLKDGGEKIDDSPDIKSMERTSGNLRIGDNVLQIGLPNGNVVKQGVSAPPCRWQPRPTPILSLPKTFPLLIGRLPQIKSAIAFSKEKHSVEFFGSPGLGKSSLLWHLGYYFQSQSRFSDGVVGFNTHYESVSDILQGLFDIFYESEKGCKPTLSEIQQALRNKQILVFLDDQNLSSDEVGDLIKTLPNITFIIASTEQRLSQTGQSLRLPGLTNRDGLTLVSHELKRSLTPEERTAFDALYLRFEGHPWLLQLTAIAMRQGVGTLAEILIKLQLADSNNWLVKQILASLSSPQLAVVAALASVGGAGLLIPQIAALSGVRETADVLASLAELKLVQAENDTFTGNGYYRYSVTSSLIDALPPEWDLETLRLRSFNYFIGWAQKSRNINSINTINTINNLLFSETDAIMTTLAWGVKSQQWAQVLSMVQTVETPIALARRWGLWEQLLKWGLQASEKLSDDATTAYILHQLGTRSFCLNDYTSAQEYLNRSLKIRQSLADTQGMEITSYTLGLIPKPETSAVVTPPKNSIPQTFKLQTSKLIYPKIRISSATLIPLTMVGAVGLTGYYLILQPKSSTTSQIPVKSTSPIPPTSKSVAVKPVSFSREKFNFGNQSIDIKNQQLFLTIINPNTTSLEVGKIKPIGKQADFEVNLDDCSNPITSNEICKLAIIFNPLTTGKHQATLPVTDSQGKIIKQIPIEGVATAPTLPFIPETNLPAPTSEVEEVLPTPKAKEFPRIRRTKIQPQVIPRESTSTTPESSPQVTPTESPTPLPTETPGLQPTPETTPEVMDTP
ncbi:hypothetical protein [Calothrix sp. PCC 6303]|uniref:hypothetical protein n=1 Tax=Calothrix sp. PCC 6303 TaxID=1170562 RepID=UPI0002A02FF1|nr:hypothetical protein [Calothrix sp. PCC 6303]AFZ01926.1 hypothetical protein Cal6303_2977 [Calothrix sp. PCC 6303]